MTEVRTTRAQNRFELESKAHWRLQIIAWPIDIIITHTETPHALRGHAASHRNCAGCAGVDPRRWIKVVAAAALDITCEASGSMRFGGVTDVHRQHNRHSGRREASNPEMTNINIR